MDNAVTVWGLWHEKQLQQEKQQQRWWWPGQQFHERECL
jgi:hypothetical protein